jgi:hypothetical protein
METRHQEVISGMYKKTFEYWLTVVSTKEGTAYECYIKLTPPIGNLIGAIITDSKGFPVISDSIEKAFSEGAWFMLSKLLGEE